MAVPQWPAATATESDTETESEEEETTAAAHLQEQEVIELARPKAEAEMKEDGWPLSNNNNNNDNIKTTEIELPSTPKTVTPVVTPKQARFEAELRRYRSRTRLVTAGEESPPVSPRTTR